jgi:hypothetical protein
VKYSSEIAFRDFEMSICNNLQGDISSIEIGLKNNISKCIMEAEEMYKKLLDEIRWACNKRPLLGKPIVFEKTDEDIFDKTSEDDNRLPIEEFTKLALSRVDKAVELFTSTNHQGEIIEFYPDHSWIDHGSSEVPKRMCEKVKAPKAYITLRDDISLSIYYRTDPELLKDVRPC